tara:strand:+ start:65 stop:1495 length:1431 start_codon:yes stop_codon:yes gene_type:complete
VFFYNKDCFIVAVSVVNQSNQSITLQVTIPFTRSMLDSENQIQDEINQAGRIATCELLKTFDTDGEALQLGSVKMTTKGEVIKLYQTPYGEIEVPRHVYQTSEGGATFCPLERDARIILTSTPRFASQVSHKMSELSAPAAQKDLEMNHNRKVSHRVMQRLAEAVASVVQIKEETWSYTVPELGEAEVTTMSIGLDGTCMLMCGGDYRQAMVGTIALYDKEGERQHTMYIAAAPEYGKETFKARLTREIQRASALYPSAIKIGVADGAHDNWDFLIKHTDKQTLDFYHASEYLTGVADTVFSLPIERKAWLEDRCHELKHAPGAAKAILTEMKGFEKSIADGLPITWTPSTETEVRGLLQKQMADRIKQESKPSRSKKEREQKQKTLAAAITYFTNNIEKSRMDYAASVTLNQPIGSGVTEAACKTIVKQRLGQSGMQWKNKGAGVILSLRALAHSTGRWEQFWAKINQCGLSMAA